MNSLQHAAHITESLATAVIFDACRANPGRKTWEGIFAGAYYAATFEAKAGGVHAVTVKDENRNVLATALVDEFDN